MQKRRNSPPAVLKIILVILAVGLFLGGTSSVHDMTPPYVQLSIQAIAADQKALASDVKSLSIRMNNTDLKIKQIDNQLSNISSNRSQYGSAN